MLMDDFKLLGIFYCFPLKSVFHLSVKNNLANALVMHCYALGWAKLPRVTFPINQMQSQN